MGANLACRWVFVLLTLPLLLRCLRSPEPVVRNWSRATIATLLISLCAPLTIERGLFAIVQAMNWACILLLIAGCTAMRMTTKSPVVASLLRFIARRPIASRA